jgi:carbonic anhydrase
LFEIAADGLLMANPGSVLSGSPVLIPKQWNPDEVLSGLLAGNLRFSKGLTENPRRSPADFRPLAQGQYPGAVLVSCADSRVAPEILFDVGVGDIFVVRVAGNVIDPNSAMVMGSIEYAVSQLNVPLVLVLGHTTCGAVRAAKEHIDAKESLVGSIQSLVDLIKPAVLQTRELPGEALTNAVIRNVQLGVGRAETSEPILGPRFREGKLRIVGAIYDLSTGLVTLVPKEPLVNP